MADPKKRARKIVSLIPGMDWQDLIALGMRLLKEELDVDDMFMETHKNGVSIHMRLADKKSIVKAKKFWSEYMGAEKDE